ncbi:MAG: hypothetical protein D6768_02330, partial [Chloroflexi bacterium]
ARAASLPPDVKGQSWAPGVLEEHQLHAYLLLGQVAQARQAYRSLLERTQRPVRRLGRAALAQARQYAQSGQVEQAIALLAPPGDFPAEALNLLANLYSLQNDWPNAARTMQFAIAQLGRVPPPGWWTNLAQFTLHAGQYRRHAETWCRFALATAQNSQRAGPLNLLGIIALGDENPARAAEFFVQAVLADPDEHEPAARDNLIKLCRTTGVTPAELFRQQGHRFLHQIQFELAAQAFAAAVELAPHDAETYKLLAVALQRAGREHDAVTAWQTAQQLENVEAA